MLRVEYNLRFDTSTYHACEAYGNLYVGGSLWDRRKVLYTKEIARESAGVLRILSGNKIQKEIFFPHMVYTVTDLLDGRLFVACKHAHKAFTLINKDGEILSQGDDYTGKGSYAVAYSSMSNEIILATRVGKLEILDADDLRMKVAVQLAPPETRLWALSLARNKIYASDYDGKVYVLAGTSGIARPEVFDVETLYSPTDSRLKEGFRPAAWGLEVLADGSILIGTRWGDIFQVDSGFNLCNSHNLGEDASCIRRISGDLFLIGTRYGKIYLFDANQFRRTALVIEIKPSFQKENAVWTLTPARNGILACFADGHVCKIAP